MVRCTCRFNESIRGTDVFIVQKRMPLPKVNNVNDAIREQLIISTPPTALRRSA